MNVQSKSLNSRTPTLISLLKSCLCTKSMPVSKSMFLAFCQTSLKPTRTTLVLYMQSFLTTIKLSGIFGSPFFCALLCHLRRPWSHQVFIPWRDWTNHHSDVNAREAHSNSTICMQYFAKHCFQRKYRIARIYHNNEFRHVSFH